MKRNQWIKKLIEAYTEEHGLEYGRRPITDGITNPRLYDTAPVKILFINKEPYDVDERGEVGAGGWSHTDYLNDKEATIITDVFTHHRVSKIASCILRNFSLECYDNSGFSWEMALEDFKKIAWINVGKFPAPGISSTSDTRLYKAYEYWKPVLLKEIEIIDADIMIFGNTFKVFEKDLIAGLTEVGHEGRTRIFIDRQQRLLIDTYHPAVRPCTISEKDYINSILRAVKKHGFRHHV